MMRHRHGRVAQCHPVGLQGQGVVIDNLASLIAEGVDACFLLMTPYINCVGSAVKKAECVESVFDKQQANARTGLSEPWTNEHERQKGSVEAVNGRRATVSAVAAARVGNPCD